MLFGIGDVVFVWAGMGFGRGARHRLGSPSLWEHPVTMPVNSRHQIVEQSLGTHTHRQ